MGEDIIEMRKSLHFKYIVTSRELNKINNNTQVSFCGDLLTATQIAIDLKLDIYTYNPMELIWENPWT